MRRNRRRRGNAIVEVAIIWMPLVLLVFGILDVTLVVFIRGMLQNATREAVRFAITYNNSYNGQTCTTHTGCIEIAVRDNSFGFLSGTVGGQPAANFIKVYFYAKDDLSTPLTQAQLPKTLPDGTVIQYLNQMGNLVEVRVENYPWSWLVPLPSNYLQGTSMTMTVAASDILQGYPVGLFAPPIGP